MTVREALKSSKKMLKDADIETYSLDAALILCFVLRLNRSSLILKYDMHLKSDEEKYIFELVKLRADRVPLSYITGIKEFMKLDFMVNEKVLIPRPDTEILVEGVIKELRRVDDPVIIDVGTGSGAIAVSLAYYIKNCTIYALDVSADALNIAYENAKKYRLTDRIKFIKSDLFKDMDDKLYKADLIVSNPPYIASGDMEGLQPEVKKEPRLALDGGSDGLDFYRSIVRDGRKLLKNRGMMAFEVGFNEAEDVVNLMKEFDIYILKDLSGMDRVVIGSLRGMHV